MDLRDCSMKVQLPHGTQVSVNFVHVMNGQCVHCKEFVRSHAIALGYPYCGLLHARCAHLFDYTLMWPHEKPAVSYGSSPPPPSQQGA